MTRRAALISATLFLATAGSAHAEKLALPVGEWGLLSSHGLDCSRPFLKIEENRVIKRLGGGEGRCPIKKLKRQGKGLLVEVKCEYDKAVPEEYFVEGDDDDNSLSVIIKNPTQILVNNTPHGLCPSSAGGRK